MIDQHELGLEINPLLLLDFGRSAAGIIKRPLTLRLCRIFFTDGANGAILRETIDHGWAAWPLAGKDKQKPIADDAIHAANPLDEQFPP